MHACVSPKTNMDDESAFNTAKQRARLQDDFTGRDSWSPLPHPLPPQG